jgi:hypothetical protein
MAKRTKIETEYGNIYATPEQLKNWEASKERDRIQEERIAAVRENARTMNRYREQAQTYKQQSRAREQRAKGGYDATPKNRYGKPIESFWAKEPPAMPEMRTAPATPSVPAMPEVATKGSTKYLTSELYDPLREPKQNIPLIPQAFSRVGPYRQSPIPNISGFRDDEYARGVTQGGLTNYAPDYGLPYPFNQRARNLWRESYGTRLQSIPSARLYPPPYMPALGARWM